MLEGSGIFLFTLTSNICISTMFAHMQLIHIYITAWGHRASAKYQDLCVSMCVQPFMFGCPLGSTGVLSDHTMPSLYDLAWLVSCILAGKPHLQCNMGGKKISTPAFFFFWSVPAGWHHVDLAMLALRPWDLPTTLASAPLVHIHSFFTMYYKFSLTLVVILVA